MKTLTLTCCFVALSLTAIAQSTEFAVFANTGLSNFRGNGSTSQTSALGYSSAPNMIYSNSMPYGTRPGILYGGGIQLQRVKASDFIIGLQSGVEVLRSHMAIKEVYHTPDPATSAPATRENATGKVTGSNTLYNLNPYVGTRWRKGYYEIDLTLGTDLGYTLRQEVKLEATTDSGLQFQSEGKSQNPLVLDIRPRAGITVYKNKLGASISYAHGLISYLRVFYDPHDKAAYPNVLKVGAHYRL